MIELASFWVDLIEGYGTNEVRWLWTLNSIIAQGVP